MVIINCLKFNLMNRFGNKLLTVGMALISLVFSSCSMMTEDLDDCPNGLYVRFVYDYNTQRADMFKDHVGHVLLMVFDEKGDKVAEKSVSNDSSYSPLSEYGYTVHFDSFELPAGRYRLQAVAMQKDWDVAADTPGAKYRRNVANRHDELHISLDHDSQPIAGTTQFPVSNLAPLDTLWHTLKVIPHEPKDGLDAPAIDYTSRPYSIYPLDDQYVSVVQDCATYATVCLIRDTKHLNITLRELDQPESVFADKYEIKIMDNNAHINHENTVLTSDSIRYTPYASWTSRFLDDGSMEIETVHNGMVGDYADGTRDDDAQDVNVVQRTAHYNLMFNRLIYNSTDNSDNAILQITNKETGKVVAQINLPSVLSQGRMAYEIYNYGHQEYLDREYDYHLDFFLRGDKWLYCDIVINVLSWSKRVQYVEL